MNATIETPGTSTVLNPLSDSLMSMIDQAHAEPGPAALVESSGVQKPPTPEPPASTPANGKAAQVEKGTPTQSEGKPEEKKAEEAKAGKVESKKEPDQHEVFKKRLNEQTAVNSRLGRELKEAQEQIKGLKQQLDGTYVPPAEPSEEEKAAQASALAEFQGRERVSRRVAFEKYGEEFVKSQIDGKDSPYGQLVAEDSTVHYGVMNSDNPVEEALNQLGWHYLKKEHGSNHDQFVQSLTAKIRAEVMAEVKQQQDGSAALVGKTVPGVGEARGAAEGREPVVIEEEFSLAGLGGHFLT